MFKKNGRRLASILAILLVDAVIIVAAAVFSLVVRFDFSFQEIPTEWKNIILRFSEVQIVVTVIVFSLRKMYHYLWRTVSVHDVMDMILSATMAFVASYIVSRLLGIWVFTSRAIVFVDAICFSMGLVGIRASYRFYDVFRRGLERADNRGDRIMIIGAGEAGRALLREISGDGKNRGGVYCIMDDNPFKWGKQMDGVPVVGGRGEIVRAAKKYNISQIIFAIPSASATQKREILEICKETGCKIRAIPGMYQMVSGEVRLADVKDVQVEDLLGREPVRLDTEALNRFLQDKTVLVTGGGGSIGSELCRQIAGYSPKKLILVDIYENNAYDIQQELKRKYPALDLTVEIASVRDKARIYSIFETLRPEVVFHAAAHKHVPLMESCPAEAIKNNVFGTYHVVRAAEKFGVKKFVMISTDKAVNPTNIMGATKRYCEMILQSRTESATEFCAVRFGNVLGSNGSVVPLFKRQIESGGPVTLTDKRIIRYFMTIPEAAQLVLEAGAMARRGQIFVLDMGEPVKILTLAENLIRLSGLVPYKDIEIKEIGLRPGEKLYEELLIRSETLSKTANEKIFVEQQEVISADVIMAGLKRLDDAVTGECSANRVITVMKELVSTYRSPEEINCAVGEEVPASAVKVEEESFRSSELQGVGKM